MSAITLVCPEIAIGLNARGAPPPAPVYAIVTVSPATVVDIPVPPTLLRVSVVVFAVAYS